MELLFQVPNRIKPNLQLMPSEEIRYCIPYDIAKDGTFREDGYVIVTTNRLIVTDDQQITFQRELALLEKIKCEPHINCGILIIKEYSQEYEKHIARCSMRHLIRASFLAKGAELLRDKKNKQVVSREREKSCLKCGRALPGTSKCPKCDGTAVTAGKLWNLLKAYKVRLILISLVAMASSAFSLYIPQYQKLFIDSKLIDKSGSTRDVIVFVIVMLVLTLFLILLQVLKNWWFVSLGARLSMDIRRKMYQKIQELTLSFIQDKRPGELMNRVAYDTGTYTYTRVRAHDTRANLR